MEKLRLDGMNEREKNRQNRQNKYENFEQDMLSSKAVLNLLSALLDKYDESKKEALNRLKENEKLLAKKLQEKLNISKDEAIKFINSDEFKDLNNKSFKFKDKDIDILKVGVLKGELRANDFLEKNKTQEIQENKIKEVQENKIKEENKTQKNRNMKR